MTIIRRTVVGASTLALIASLLTGAFANCAELPKRSVLTLEAAQRDVQAAKKEAADHGWARVIAVVDDEGLLVTMVRMDNAAVPATWSLLRGRRGPPPCSVDRPARWKRRSMDRGPPRSRPMVS
jgi:hypothetical protein